MRLTSFTDYGLRMLMLLAGRPDQPLSTAEMAAELRLPRNHLTKIMQRLSRAGIVETRRGGGGGAILAHPPERIRLGAVVRLLEQDRGMVECFRPDGGACIFGGCCGLKTRLRRAEAAFMADLDRSTLADIARPAIAA